MTGSRPRPVDGIAFVDDGGLRPPAAPAPVGRRPRWLVPAVVAAVGVLVAVAVTTRSEGHRVAAHPRSAAGPCAGCTVHDAPTPAMIDAVGLHLPGSVLTSERTTVRYTAGRATLVARTVTVVQGNVTITMTVTPQAHTAVAPRTTRYAHGPWLITFRTTGYYAPAGNVLETLAAEPALVSASG